jgi:hypothetical protein
MGTAGARLCFLGILAMTTAIDVAAAVPSNDGVDLPALLPAELETWEAPGPVVIFDRDSIFDYMNGAGEMYRAFDFRRLVVREYERSGSSGQRRLVAELYDMGRSSDAYGIFTQDTDGQSAEVGRAAIYSAGLLRFWRGRWFVRLLEDQAEAGSRVELEAIGRRIAEQLPDRGEPPAILRVVEGEGLIGPETRYFHDQISLDVQYYLASDNILGLSRQTEAVLARYQQGEDKLRLLVVRYPKAAEAAAAFSEFQRAWFPETGLRRSGRRVEALEDGRYVGAQRTGAWLLLVFESPDGPTCETYLGRVAARIGRSRR